MALGNNLLIEVKILTYEIYNKYIIKINITISFEEDFCKIKIYKIRKIRKKLINK